PGASVPASHSWSATSDRFRCGYAHSLQSHTSRRVPTRSAQWDPSTTSAATTAAPLIYGAASELHRAPAGSCREAGAYSNAATPLFDTVARRDQCSFPNRHTGPCASLRRRTHPLPTLGTYHSTGVIRPDFIRP